MRLLHNTRQNAVPTALALGVLSLLPCVPSSAAPISVHRQSAPDSFAPAPAVTVQSLLSQVQSNPSLCRRYASHFHIPDSQVLTYLRRNLVVSRLAHDSRYTMFCVRPNGLVYPTVLPLPRGTRVFALRSGPIVLTCPEGNPLTLFRTAVETRTVPSSAAKPMTVEAAPPRQVVTPTQPREIVVPTSVPTPVYQAISPLTPAEQADTEPSATPAPAKP